MKVIALTQFQTKETIGFVVSNIVTIIDHRTDNAIKDNPNFQYTTINTTKGEYRVEDTLNDIMDLINLKP